MATETSDEVLAELAKLTSGHVHGCQCLPCLALDGVEGALEQYIQQRQQDPSVLDPLIQVDNDGRGAFGDE